MIGHYTTGLHCTELKSTLKRCPRRPTDWSTNVLRHFGRTALHSVTIAELSLGADAPRDKYPKTLAAET